MTDQELKYSKDVTNRYLELIKEGKIFYHDEARIVDHINNQYEPITISEFGRLKSKNYKLVKEDLDKKKLAYIPFGGVNFIYKNLN